VTTEIGVRELRNDVSDVLRRVEAGDEFVVTVHGRPVARVTSLDSRPRTMPTDVFFAALAKVAADPDLIGDLEETLPDTTDDIDPWSG
jgi:prevent-host-death family protein